MDIHELFEAAGNLHGHLCPGLAVGVRAAAEASGLLHGELRCAIESRACWADGFQSVLGATVGNGRLCLRETGKPVFNFTARAASCGCICVRCRSLRINPRSLNTSLPRLQPRSSVPASPICRSPPRRSAAMSGHAPYAASLHVKTSCK